MRLNVIYVVDQACRPEAFEVSLAADSSSTARLSCQKLAHVIALMGTARRIVSKNRDIQQTKAAVLSGVHLLCLLIKDMNVLLRRQYHLGGLETYPTHRSRVH
jgi:hypothetical protein